MMRAPTVRGFQRTPSAGIFRRAAGFSPLRLPNLAAWYDLGPTRQASTTSNDIRIDASNRVSLIADRSGNSGVNCLCLNNASGNTASVPNASYYRSGDLDIRLDLRANDYTPSAAQALMAKRVAGSGQASWQVVLDTTGVLQMTHSTDGSTLVAMASTASVAATDLSRIQIRVTLDVDNGAGGKTARFFTRASGALNDSTGWTQLGSDVTTAGAITLFNGTDPVHIGGIGGVTTANFGGIIYAAWFTDTIGGTTPQLNADFSAAGKLVSSFTESSTNAATVTINSSGDLGARICGERDLVQLTASKQPIYLPWSGTNYGWLRGASGDFFSTPDSASVSVTGDIDLRARVALNDYTPASNQTLISKYAGAAARSYLFRINSTGNLVFTWSADGTAVTSATSTASVPTSDFGTVWLRVTHDVDNGAGGKTTTFFTSSDGDSWSQLGSAVTTAGTTSIFDSATAVEIGGWASGTAEQLAGSIFRAQVLNGIGGTVVADFDPSRYTSGTTFTASTGETWTLNGGATIVTNTSLYFDGTDDYMKAPAFSLSQPESVYFVGQQVSWTANDYFFDGNTTNGGAMYQLNVSPQINIYAGTGIPIATTALQVRTTGIFTSLFNGASSLSRVNRLAATTGSIGTNGLNGFMLGAGQTAPTGFGNIRTNEVAIYAAAHDTATQDRFALAMGSKWRFSV